jgi:hypothetical protein
MTDEHKSTRLGDLLVERGIITRLQLAHAIELQQMRRQQALSANAPDSKAPELGELLIELGFINRSQLKSSLSWQRHLRKTTAVMVFIAPLLTAACGGGGGGAASNNTHAPTQNSQTVSSEPVVDKLVSSSATSVEQEKETAPANSSIGNSLSSISSSSFSLQSSSSAPSALNGPVQVYWTPPSQRENGEYLDITELGGYELRYKRISDNSYTSVVIKDAYIDSYYFDNLQGDYEFQIAAFDVNGIYSAFVQVKRM